MGGVRLAEVRSALDSLWQTSYENPGGVFAYFGGIARYPQFAPANGLRIARAPINIRVLP